MNNNEEIIFSNNENNSENLNDTFFKNNKITIEEEVYIPEEERLYLDDNILIKEIETQILNSEPVSRQSLLYIQENAKERAKKIINTKNSLKNKIEMYRHNIKNPLIFNFLNNNFKNNWIIPIILNKHKIFSKLYSNDEQTDLNENSDFLFTDTLEDEKGIVIENQVNQFILMKKLLHESNINKLSYRDYINQISNIADPYGSVLLSNNEINSGYLTKINEDILFLRYYDLETLYWNTIINLSDTNTYIDILDDNRKLKKIKSIPIVKTDNVNIIGFMILPNGGKLSYTEEVYYKNFYKNNLSKTLVKIGDISKISKGKKVIITINNHNLKDHDKIFISDSNSLPNINGIYQNSLTVIDNNNISININNEIKEGGNKGIIYSVSKLNFDLYHITKNKNDIEVNYIKTVNRLDPTESDNNPKVYIMNNLLIYDKKDLEELYKKIIPTNKNILDSIHNQLIRCFTFNDINILLQPYGINTDNLNKDEMIIIKDIINTNIKNIIESEKSIKNLNEIKYFAINKELFTDSTFFLNNINFNSDEVIASYGKYPHLNTKYDSVGLRLSWLFSQLDSGHMYFKLYNLDNYKNFIVKQNIKNVSNELTDITKEITSIEKEFNKEIQLNKNVKICKLYKYEVDNISKLDSIDKSSLTDKTLALYKSYNETKIYEWDASDQKWVESETKPIYNELKFLCEFSNTDLKNITLEDLECIYRKEFGCKSRLYFRYENRLHQLEKIKSDYEKLHDYIKNDIFKKEIHEEIDNLKNKYFYGDKSLVKGPIKEGEKGDKEDKEQTNNVKKINSKVDELISILNNLSNNDLRKKLLYQIIDKDGLLIGKDIYSKKYKNKLDICGHYYYLKKEYYSNSIDQKTLIINEMLNIFSDNGEASHDAQICNHCGTYLLNIEYDDSEGFSESGMIIRSREVWKEDKMKYSEDNIIETIEEKVINCSDPYFQDILLEKGLHISEINNALKICTFIENNLMAKCGIRINVRDLITIIIDSIQKIKLIIPYNVFKVNRVKYFLEKGYTKDKIEKLDSRNFFKDEYNTYYNLKKNTIIAARFLINVQTVVPPYLRDSSRSPCPFISFNGLEGFQYIACILKEMNVITINKGGDKTDNLLNILIKNIEDAYNSFKYNKTIHQLFIEKAKYNKLKLSKFEFYSLKESIIIQNIKLPDLINDNIIQDVKNGNISKTKEYHLLFNNNILYATKKIMSIINDVISHSSILDKSGILLENSCCIQEINKYLSYYDYIALNYNSDNKGNNIITDDIKIKEIYKNIFSIIEYVNRIYSYNGLFLNRGVFDRFLLYSADHIPVTITNVTLFRPNNINNEIIKDYFCLYVDKGELKGTLRKYTGIGESKKDLITGELYSDIRNREYTIAMYSDLLDIIKNKNYKIFIDNKYDIKKYINNRIIILKKDSYQYLENRINTMVLYLAKSLNEHNNKEFINRYTNLLRNLGDFSYHINDEEDSSKKNSSKKDKIKNNNLLNKLKLRYLKKVYNNYFRKNINIIKNGFDKSKQNIELDFAPSESIVLDIQQSIYQENNIFTSFMSDDIRKYFEDIVFDLSTNDINNINGICDIYDIKYENITFLSDFNFTNACNVLLYLLVEQLIKYLTCTKDKEYKEEQLIDEITLTNNEEDDLIKDLYITSDKCKYISKFCVEVFNIIEDEYDYLDICSKNMHKFKNVLLQDIIIKNIKLYIKETEEDSREYFMKNVLSKMHEKTGFSVNDIENDAILEQDEIDTTFKNNETDEYISEMAIKELTKKYGTEPTKDQIEDFKSQYMANVEEYDELDEGIYSQYRAKQGLEIVDVGTGYGDLDHTIEDEGDMVIADPDFYD